MTKGLYIHLPFCKEKCPYCIFDTIETTNKNLICSYIDYLITKIDQLNPLDFDTIYLGGGTPNYIDNNNLDKFLSALDRFKPLEYTIELNPEFITIDQLYLLKKHHVNRVSLGVQTFNKLAQKSIERYYHFKDIKLKINHIKSIIGDNISLDIIFNYPYQKLNDIKRDVKKILKLKATHISIYDLIYEEGSKLTYLIKKKQIIKNNDDLSFYAYKYIINKLKKAKFKQYEISSFAKDNFESIHNKKYWLHQDYLAIGLGASSFINNVEITNSNTLKKLYNEEQNLKELSLKDQMSRYMFMGLRLINGIKPDDFKTKFNCYPQDIFNIKELVDNNLLEYSGNYLRLTNKGLFLANLVFEEFI